MLSSLNPTEQGWVAGEGMVSRDEDLLHPGAACEEDTHDHSSPSIGQGARVGGGVGHIPP